MVACLCNKEQSTLCLFENLVAKDNYNVQTVLKTETRAETRFSQKY